MPRSSPLAQFTQRNDGSFAIKRPKRSSANVSSAALRKVKDVRPNLSNDVGWQTDAFTYNELVPEVGFVNNVTANTVAAADLLIVRRDESGDWVESSDPRAESVMDAFVGPVGGREELLRRAALHMQIAGESWLLGTDIFDEHEAPLGTLWEFLSTSEVKVDGDGNVNRNPSGTKQSSYGSKAADGGLDEDVYIARLWRSDPQWSDRADSPMKRVLPLCREVVILSQVVDAVAKSRLAAGILFVPDEMSFGPDDETEDPGDDTDDIDEFMSELIQHLSAPVDDRTSAAALVPLLMRGAAELGESVRLIDVARDLDSLYQELRKETLERIARGLDIPPEIMEGKGSLNHWTGYNIDSEFASKHVIPLGDMLAEFITTSYFRPMLVQFEGFTEEQAEGFALRFDPSSIISKPEPGQVRGAWDRRVVNDLTYLRSLGLDEDAMPDEEEKKRRWLEAVLESDPVYWGPSLLPILHPELEGLFDAADAARRQVEIDAAPTGRRIPSPSDVGLVDDDPSEGMDEPGDAVEAGNETHDLDALIDMLTVAADAALERALERAANRVLTNKIDGSLREELRTVPKTQVLTTIGRDRFGTLGLSESEISGDAWDSFEMKGRMWVRRHIAANGAPEWYAEEQADAVMAEMVPLLQSHMLSSLRRPLGRGENGLLVPNELIRMALTAADRAIGVKA